MSMFITSFSGLKQTFSAVCLKPFSNPPFLKLCSVEPWDPVRDYCLMADHIILQCLPSNTHPSIYKLPIYEMSQQTT